MYQPKIIQVNQANFQSDTHTLTQAYRPQMDAVV